MAASRALAENDIAHRFVASFVYDLPIGPGRWLNTGDSRLVNAIYHLPERNPAGAFGQ